MCIPTERPETEFEREKRLAREKREYEIREANRRKEASEMPVDQLKTWDLMYIDDPDRLCQILRESSDWDLVAKAIDRIYHLRMDDDIETVESCLPGRCTELLLNFICNEQHISVYSYLTVEHRGRLLIPALQRGCTRKSEELLDGLYHRKYHHYINRENGMDLDYHAAMAQFDRAKTPEEAFRNISPYDYDEWYEFDDSDEFSYLDSLDSTPFSIRGYDLHDWRLHCLRAADLLTEDD